MRPRPLALLLLCTRALAALLPRQGPIGSNICATAMRGFPCTASNHNENRCAGDDYHYCICYGQGGQGDRQGFWGDSAWGPPCDVCIGQGRGAVFDGTCLGNGNTPGRRRVCTPSTACTTPPAVDGRTTVSCVTTYTCTYTSNGGARSRVRGYL